jgi:hypothetical protein
MGCATTILLQVPFPTDPATKWIGLGFVAFALVYITFIRPQRKRNRKDPLARSPAPAGLSQQRAVERDMSHLLVEMSEMARQMTAQLDTRAAKLELLIKEADARIAAMKAAAAGITVLPAGEEPVEKKEFAIPEAPLLDEPEPPTVDPRHVDVYEMADQGRSPHEIAQELGRPTGEVELILALRGGA